MITHKSRTSYCLGSLVKRQDGQCFDKPDWPFRDALEESSKQAIVW